MEIIDRMSAKGPCNRSFQAIYHFRYSEPSTSFQFPVKPKKSLEGHHSLFFPISCHHRIKIVIQEAQVAESFANELFSKIANCPKLFRGNLLHDFFNMRFNSATNLFFHSPYPKSNFFKNIRLR